MKFIEHSLQECKSQPIGTYGTIMWSPSKYHINVIYLCNNNKVYYSESSQLTIFLCMLLSCFNFIKSNVVCFLGVQSKLSTYKSIAGLAFSIYTGSLALMLNDHCFYCVNTEFCRTCQVLNWQLTFPGFRAGLTDAVIIL